MKRELTNDEKKSLHEITGRLTSEVIMLCGDEPTKKTVRDAASNLNSALIPPMRIEKQGMFPTGDEITAAEKKYDPKISLGDAEKALETFIGEMKKVGAPNKAVELAITEMTGKAKKLQTQFKEELVTFTAANLGNTLES